MKTETTSLLISDDDDHLLIFLKRELATCSDTCCEKPAHLWEAFKYGTCNQGRWWHKGYDSPQKSGNREWYRHWPQRYWSSHYDSKKEKNRINKDNKLTENNLHIKNCPEEDRPREIFLEKGPEALSDEALLAILLRAGRQGRMYRFHQGNGRRVWRA